VEPSQLRFAREFVVKKRVWKVDSWNKLQSSVVEGLIGNKV
jgi:hypothetical protein